MKKLIFLLGILIATYSLTLSQERFEYDDPARRAEEFNKQRAYPFDKIPDLARQKAFEQSKLLYQKLSSNLLLAEQPEWKPIGPFDVGGRIKSIVFHPTKKGLVYASAAAGGIWRSSNFGNNWEPILDYENGIAFGALAIDLNNPNTLYAGTGESVIGGGTIYLGNGIYKTTDGGNTWKLLGLTEVGAFSRIYVHPQNSNIVVAGATIRKPGFYISTDAGQSWNRMIDKNVTDVSINPENPAEYLIGINGEGVYYTSDMGKSWENRSKNFEQPFGRISVKFAPSDPNIAYALLDMNISGLIYRTTNKGLDWVLVFRGDQTFFRGQGFYNNFIEVHPTNPNLVLAGGIDVFRTSDGKTWTNVTNGYSGGSVHVDQHCAAFNPIDPNIVMLGNDGGIYFSSDAGINWVVRNNNLQVTQFYGFDIDNTQPNINYGGTQDNGTLGNDADLNWSFIAGGDGFRTVVDYNNPNIVFGQSTPGGVIKPFKLNIKTGAFTYIDNGIDFSDAVWDPPLVIDPQINSILYYGRTKLYASYNGGSSWELLRTPFTNGRFTAIDISPLNSEHIMAGTSGGDLIISTDGGEKWSNLSGNGLVNRWVTDIAFSNQTEGKAYVTFSGFYTPHIFKTTNFGQTWIDISRTFPDIPVNTIALHPFNDEIIFVGTDIGVFASYDGGANWFPFGNKLPKSPVTDLKFCKYSLTSQYFPLRVATHGRGIWETQVPFDVINSFEITSPSGGEIFVSSTQILIAWYGFAPPVRVEFSADDGQSWRTIAEDVVSSPLLWTLPNVETDFARVRISSLSNSEQTKISNSFSITLIEKGSILKATSVNFVPYGIAFDGKEGLWVTSFNSNQLVKLNANTFAREKSVTLPGDSLFTDIAYDRDNNIIYVHRMNSTNGNGGNILIVDTNGKLIRQFPSPANVYPIGLEVFDGKLLVGDRDKKDQFGRQLLMVVNPNNGTVEATYPNPYSKTYGPRGLAYDRKQYVFQVGTYFPSGGALTEAVAIKIDKSDLSQAEASIPLQTMTGLINARGIEFDPRDNNLWISTYDGSIYKIAGFDLIVGVNEGFNYLNRSNIVEFKAYPNPTSSNIIFSVIPFIDLENVSIQIQDPIGNKIEGLSFNNINRNETKVIIFDTKNLISGIYFVTITTDNKKIVVDKIMIVK